ncbi:MAG TPA: DUF5663 domain-containing protein [Melioribacteraceae bacterium]|nr:DUF5663 domain-containing protein [Melioribacteraceae bacterium]
MNTENNQKAEDFFKELGVENISTEERQKIGQSIQKLLQERIMLKIDNILTEEQKKSLLEFAEKNKGKDLTILNFIINIIPNYEDLLQDELLSIKQELIQE